MRISGSLLGAALALVLGSVPAYAQTVPDLAPGAITKVEIDGLPITDFRAKNDEVRTVRKERVIGRRNFVPVRNLDKESAEYKLSRMVGQILMVNEQGEIYSACTGFLVAHNLMLTNHHCVYDDSDNALPLADLLIGMEHLEENKFTVEGSHAGVERIVADDAYLDYALIKLNRPLGRKYGWLDLDDDRTSIEAHQEVKIIQHPSARAKRIVLEDTEVVARMGKFLHYVADTEGGSSGSPVFGLSGSKVIALHHVGTNAYNEGTMMNDIVAEIARYLPDGPGAPGEGMVSEAPPADGAGTGTASAGAGAEADNGQQTGGGFGTGGDSLNSSGSLRITDY